MTYSLLRPSNSGKAPNKTLAEAEAFVKSALDGLTAHIAILDEDGTIVYINKTWRRFADSTDYPLLACGLGANYLQVCDEAAARSEEMAQVASGLRSVKMRLTEEFHAEYPCQNPAERRWFTIQVTRFSWYGTDRMIISHQNITSFKLSQLEARNNQRWVEAIIDNLVDGVMAFNEHGKIISLNPAGSYIFGYERSEILGKNVGILLPTLPDEIDDEVLAEFVERVSGLGDEIEGRRKDGSIFPMYFALSRVNFDETRLYTVIIQDFTERKYFEAQLWDKQLLNLELEKARDLRDLKNSFISMMSHDLKTPLAAIRLANSMLRQYGDRATEAEKRESYDAIDQQVEYLTELVNDVMAISRTDFSGTELNLELVDLVTYCRDVIEELQLAYRMQCCLDYVGPDNRLEARIDKKLMRRALTNLLSNSIKYSGPDSPVTLELNHQNSDAIITIRDHGIGIPPEDLKHMFEPFHRASNVGKIAGTGLGLAITKQAVDLHGGTIVAESTVNVGTTFTINLPLNR